MSEIPHVEKVIQFGKSIDAMMPNVYELKEMCKKMKEDKAEQYKEMIRKYEKQCEDMVEEFLEQIDIMRMRFKTLQYEGENMLG